MIKIRTLKRPWAYCATDNSHGKAKHELIIEIGYWKQRWWLCDNCLNELQLELERKVAEVLDNKEQK